MFEWIRPGAELDYVKAIELDPDNATAHQWYGELLGIQRRWDAAVAEARRAVELEPLSRVSNAVLGVLLMRAGRLDEAILMCERALRIAPDWIVAIDDLAKAHVLKGDYAAAAPLFDRLAQLTGSDPEAYRAFLAALADPAKTPAAVAALEAADVYSNTGGSEYLAHLGASDAALAALEREYEARNPRLPWVNANPLHDGIRSDPRFRELLNRMKFAD